MTFLISKRCEPSPHRRKKMRRPVTQEKCQGHPPAGGRDSGLCRAASAHPPTGAAPSPAHVMRTGTTPRHRCWTQTAQPSGQVCWDLKNPPGLTQQKRKHTSTPRLDHQRSQHTYPESPKAGITQPPGTWWADERAKHGDTEATPRCTPHTGKPCNLTLRASGPTARTSQRNSSCSRPTRGSTTDKELRWGRRAGNTVGAGGKRQGDTRCLAWGCSHTGICHDQRPSDHALPRVPQNTKTTLKLKNTNGASSAFTSSECDAPSDKVAQAR